MNKEVLITDNDTRIKTVDDYLFSNVSSTWFKQRYGSPYMANESFYNENGYVYSYMAGLNLKPSNAIKLPTGVYRGDGINKYPKVEANEIMVYQLASPYFKFNISKPISFLNSENVLQEMKRYLIQFQQLNFCYNPSYDLNLVYDDVAIRIQHQTGLIPNMKELKDGIMDDVVNIFESSIGGDTALSKYTTVSEVVEGLELGVVYSNYIHKNVYHDGRKLLLKAIRKQESSINNAMINDCIYDMMSAEMFICNETIKDQIHSTGLRQIKTIVAERKQEINYYNLSLFNVKTYSKWKDKYWENENNEKVPHVIYNTII